MYLIQYHIIKCFKLTSTLIFGVLTATLLKMRVFWIQCYITGQVVALIRIQLTWHIWSSS